MVCFQSAHGEVAQSVPEEDKPKSLQSMILELKTRHRQLDSEIQQMEGDPYSDQLAIRRKKKEKLKLKDCIALLNHQLIPDLDA